MYCTTDANGWPTGFYLDDYHTIPADAVTITKEQYSQLLKDRETARLVNGNILYDAVKPEMEIPPEIAVGIARKKAVKDSILLLNDVKDPAVQQILKALLSAYTQTDM